jgi:hypothetical protein
MVGVGNVLYQTCTFMVTRRQAQIPFYARHIGDKKPGTNPLSSNIPTLLAPNHLLHSFAMKNPECEMAPAILKWKKERPNKIRKKRRQLRRKSDTTCPHAVHKAHDEGMGLWT